MTNRLQPSLFDQRFDGDDYVDKRDRLRLKGQIRRIYELMVDGDWRTLNEITNSTGDPEASVSAQLRHLRKERFGGHTVNRRHRGDIRRGLYEYQLIMSKGLKYSRGL